MCYPVLQVVCLGPGVPEFISEHVGFCESLTQNDNDDSVDCSLVEEKSIMKTKCNWNFGYASV